MNRLAILKDDLRFMLLQSRDALFPPRPRLAVALPADIVSLEGLRPERPEWMVEEDPLGRAVLEWESVFRSGTTTWGCILMANTNLFQDGDSDHPAIIAWSPEGSFDSQPEELEAVVRTVFDSATSEEAPANLHEVSELIQNNLDRAFGVRVPPDQTGGRSLFLAAILVPRDHLPGRRLIRSLMPIRSGEVWEFPVIVPWQFWSPETVRWWLKGGRLHALGYRIRMLGGPGGIESHLPLETRRFLSAWTPSRGMLFGSPILGLVVLGTWWTLRSHVPVNAHFLIVLVGLILLFMVPIHYAEGFVIWRRYQRVIDVYEDLWRRTGMPWTRFLLLPSEMEDSRYPGYGLYMKVLGNVVVLHSNLHAKDLYVSVRTDSDREDLEKKKLGRLFALPTDAQSRTQLLSEIKALYRKLGEPETIAEPPQESSWD